MAYAGQGMAAMARPCKQRRICSEPACRRFEPEKKNDDGLSVTMTFDEYETIRLIDFAGLTQEQCAAQMGVARATVQAIYTAARAKLARCLVLMQPLKIGGGDVILCERKENCAVCLGRSGKRDGRMTIMKIATTYDHGQIRRDSTEPRPRGCSVPGEPPQGLPSF